ncbi:hypothetical protein BVX97_04205 [bacterium E08(2017)]|nr:hypothetical protein BVX97_04205 [bacterium E08(2017)]
MFYTDLTEEEKVELAKFVEVLKVPKHDYVVREGEEGDAMFIVKSGWLEIQKRIYEDNTKPLKQLSEGAIFGELSFLGAGQRVADVVALEDSEVLKLTQEGMQELNENDAGIMAKLYRNIAVDLAAKLHNTTTELRTAVYYAIEGLDA